MNKPKEQVALENALKKSEDRNFESEQLIRNLKSEVSNLSSFSKGKRSTKDSKDNTTKIQFDKTLKENEAIINKVRLTKQKRHVKEPQEKVFKNILNDFTVNYANLVVANTTKEIVKLMRK